MTLLTRNRTETSTPLSADVIKLVLHRHRAAQDEYGSRYDVFSEQLLFRPSDGQLCGTSGMPEAADHLHRFVRVSTHHRLTESELEQVTVDREGTVHQPPAMEVHDPVDEPDVVPEPEPKLRPATVVGERVAGVIWARHEQRVPQEVRWPGRGRSTPYQLPVDVLLYGVDGRALGSAMSLDGQEHANRCVRIPTNRLPTLQEIAAVAIDEYGTVGEVQP